MINTREYEEKDKETIIKLVGDILFEIFNVEARNIEDLKNIKEEYFKKNGIFYVVEDNGKIVGTVAVKNEKDNVARLKRMFVYKEHRKQKIGQMLLNKIFEFCKSREYKKIILSTYPHMKTAIKCYKKNGFIECKRNEQIFFEKTLNFL